LIGAPLLGVETFAVTGSLFGWRFATTRYAWSIVAATGAALVIHRLATRASTAETTTPPDHSALDTSFMARFGAALDRLVFHAGAWLTLGLLLATLAELTLASGTFASLGWRSLLLLITVLVAPVAICATALTPLAAVLVAHGLPAGAALVALVLGTATGRAVFDFSSRTFGLPATLGGSVAFLALCWLGGTSLHAVPLFTTSPAFVSTGAGGALSAAVLIALLVRVVWRAGARVWLAAAFAGRPTALDRPGPCRDSS
jgi:uncharacterized membrane protein YraQ (UPF0718 family)